MNPVTPQVLHHSDGKRQRRLSAARAAGAAVIACTVLGVTTGPAAAGRTTAPTRGALCGMRSGSWITHTAAGVERDQLLEKRRLDADRRSGQVLIRHAARRHRGKVRAAEARGDAVPGERTTPCHKPNPERQLLRIKCSPRRQLRSCAVRPVR